MPNEAAAEEPVDPLPAANPSDEPTGGTHLAAIFDREVTLMNITDHVILFDTPELVLTMDQLEGMSLVDLLQGVTATDETGAAVQVELAEGTSLVIVELADDGEAVESTSAEEDAAEAEPVVDTLEDRGTAAKPTDTAAPSEAYLEKASPR